MKDIYYRLIRKGKKVGYEKHKLLKNPMVKESVYIFHSRTGHAMSWKDIVLCPKEYIFHDDKQPVDPITGRYPLMREIKESP